LIWRFTLVLIKINYGQIGDQTGLFYTTKPVFYTSGNRFVRHPNTIIKKNTQKKRDKKENNG
jgi:hypothetical protein